MDAVVDYRYKKFKKGERVFSKSSATSRAAVTGEDILDPEEKSRFGWYRNYNPLFPPFFQVKTEKDKRQLSFLCELYLLFLFTNNCAVLVSCIPELFQIRIFQAENVFFLSIEI